MRTSDRLVALLQQEGLDVASVERRVRGFWQTAAGAWAWSAHRADGVEVTGSEDTMTECVRRGITITESARMGTQVHARMPRPCWHCDIRGRSSAECLELHHSHDPR